MRSYRLLASSLALLSAPVALGAQVQSSNIQLPADAATNKQAVVDIFTQSYSSYQQFAAGHDEVAPIRKTALDPRNGWGASVVDAMTTMYIMGLDDLFSDALTFAQNINFNQSATSDTVSVFESTIRYVAGLLSAYELSGKQHPFLVDKAKELADRLSLGFQSGSPVPYGFVDFKGNKPVQDSSNIAEAGTLTMEWAKLSEYTGNDTYRQLAEGAARTFPIRAQNRIPDDPSGFPAQGIDPATGEPVGGYVTWGGGSDSYLEYLIKYPRLTNTDDDFFVNTWTVAVETSVNTLAKALQRSTVGNFLYLADYDDNRQIRHTGSHLACFHAGNWLLGGKLLNNDTIVNLGLELNDACWNTYAGTATGIGPETFAFASSDGDFTGNGDPNSQQTAFYQQHGYYITDSDYVQRPEVLESNFYAWRVTGDTKYTDRAASAVNSFNEFLKVDTGFTGINNVDNTSGGRVDETESFWFAEVLKYLYLTFDDPEKYSLDNYVFNTEAHPFAAPPAKASYGSGIAPATITQPFVAKLGPLPQVSPRA
ncbi:seven-hairpin glycosidase [Amylostereum chailletii]|nr:seven-hairpin glycosidase [Amylostereum chailletii]